MSPPNHDSTENEFTEGVPSSAEAVGYIRETDTDSYASIAGNDFEDDVEDRVVHRITLKLTGLGYCNEQHCEHKYPDVVGDLRPKLLSYKISSGFLGRGMCCEPASHSFEERTLGVLTLLHRIVGIDTQTPFFVDVAVSHSNHHRVDGDIHHDDVEYQKANAKFCNCDDIETAAADRECLKKTIKHTSAARKTSDRRISNIKYLEGHPIDTVEHHHGTEQPPCVS